MSDKELINYEDKDTIATLVNTVAKGATPEEFKLFVEMCKATGLNPFKKEIWFIKANNQVQMMTGINGFYTIANSHPQFDGIETEIVQEGKTIIKAVARVYRKDRRIPMTAEAYMDEYGKSYGTWKSMPRVMLSKCAESMALRKAFPQELNGLYTQEEMPGTYSQQPQPDLIAEQKKQEAEAQAEQERRAKAFQLQQKRTAWSDLTKQAMADGTAFQYMADSDDDKKALVKHCEEEGIAYYADRKEGCLWTVIEIPDAGMYCTHYPEIDEPEYAEHTDLELQTADEIGA